MPVDGLTSAIAPGEYMFGPGALYIDTSPGYVPAGYSGATGTGTELGLTGPMSIKPMNSKTELQSIQRGAGKDDAAINYQAVSIETTLRNPNNQILEKTIQGFSLETVTNGDIKRVWFSNRLGERDRSRTVQMTFVKIVNGLEDWTNPMSVFDFFAMCADSQEPVLTMDAESQQEWAVTFYGYQSRDIKDHNGRNAFFASREID